MNRTITIKGIGKLSLKPDYVVITFSLESKNKDYNKAMSIASEDLDKLRSALATVGFAKEDLKTSNFSVSTQYENKRDIGGNYKQHFTGYNIRHDLKLEFEFSTLLLSKTLNAISTCIAEPKLIIDFTIKDQDEIKASLLESACKNAKAKAEILTKASHVTLGELTSIDYNWGELHLFSPTQYDFSCNYMGSAQSAPSANINIEPDDIDVSDNVTFVWEIK